MLVRPLPFRMSSPAPPLLLLPPRMGLSAAAAAAAAATTAAAAADVAAVELLCELCLLIWPLLVLLLLPVCSGIWSRRCCSRAEIGPAQHTQQHQAAKPTPLTAVAYAGISHTTRVLCGESNPANMP
jgi:hypothetical protein